MDEEIERPLTEGVGTKSSDTAKSDALGAIHETVSDMFKFGVIGEQTMHHFDETCLMSERCVSEELEEERQRYLKMYEEAKDECLPDVAPIPDLAPGSFSFHEVFHTSFVMYSMMEEHIVSQPAVFTNPEVFAEVAKARDALWELYQKLGERNL
jgi:hypothetical protein